MKTILKLWGILAMIWGITSCSSLKKMSFYDDTDSYVDIKKERQKKMEMWAQQKKQEEERQKYVQDSIAKAQENINNNPYYKEPNHNKEDYYDYEYAARLKRFYNPVNGLGYYDNWYTNPAFYGAPNYGSSIYMGWGNYSPYLGLGYSYTWGNPFYGTYWGSPFYSPYYNNMWGYSPFGTYYSPWNTWAPWGYYSPYYNPYYSPYYYYNSYDVNSMTYAPRNSRDGFNSRTTTNNISRGSDNFISKNPVHPSPEINIPKFDETARPKPVSKIEPSHINALNMPLINQLNNHPNISTNLFPRNLNNSTSTPVIINNNQNVGVPVNPRGTSISPGRPANSNPNTATPIQVSPTKKSDNFIQETSPQRNWGGGSNSGGFSTPGGGSSGDGGFARPR